MTPAYTQAFRPFIATPLVLALLLAGCQTPLQPLPGPVDYGRSPKSIGTLGTADPGTTRTETAITSVPTPPPRTDQPQKTSVSPAASLPDGEEEVSMAIEQTPLPMFIQILYGNVLKRAYSLDPAVTSRTDPVTFKTSRPISKNRMQQIAANLLRSYGLSVIDLEGLVRITPDAANTGTALQVQMGKSASSSADPFRPIYHYVELETIRTAEMTPWLRQILGTRVTMQEDTGRNAFLLSGTTGDVRAALELIQSFDQPRMRGRVARRITPAYASASELSTRLAEVLTTQGYSVSTTGSTGTAAIVLMPVVSSGGVLVFTSSNATMAHVEKWAKELDRPASGPSANALFTYPVKYADAQELAKTLGELLGGAAAPAAGAAGAQRSGAAGRVVVNNATNTLIFKGSSADEQQQIKDLLRELDRPTKSAMIEVVVAEVQRGALETLGVSWDYSSAGRSGALARGTATAGAAGLKTSYITSGRALLVALDALATDSQARILSNPKILARNGETASIQVGSEVPIITSQQSTATGGSLFPGTAGVIQQVQYRSTGVLLRVRPVINSGNRLDLEVSQEVSSAATTQTGVSASPTISTRRIETKLSLRDGSTILLGGLIAHDDSFSDSGVPFLKDIPGIGSLFSTKTNNNKQTELMVMITPYVINDDYEAEELTQAVQATFGDWAKDLKTSRVAREPLPPTESVPGPASTAPPSIQVPLPQSTEPRLPPAKEPTSASPLPRAEPAAAVPAKVEPDFEVSRPAGAPAPAVSTLPPQTSPAASSPAAAASAPPTPSKPPVALPAGTQGSAVTDPKILEEILKRVKPK